MADDDLVRDSRKIAEYFEPYGEDEAMAGVLGHLRQFWEPRMRERLVHIHAQTPELLHPAVRCAAARLAAME